MVPFTPPLHFLSKQPLGHPLEGMSGPKVEFKHKTQLLFENANMEAVKSQTM